MVVKGSDKKRGGNSIQCCWIISTEPLLLHTHAHIYALPQLTSKPVVAFISSSPMVLCGHFGERAQWFEQAIYIRMMSCVHIHAGLPAQPMRKDNARVYALPRVPINHINKLYRTDQLIAIVAMAPADPSDRNSNRYQLDPESEKVRLSCTKR